jgi:hypothetical protein
MSTRIWVGVLERESKKEEGMANRIVRQLMETTYENVAEQTATWQRPRRSTWKSVEMAVWRLSYEEQ